MTNIVDIVLTTFNGEKYIEAQIESIINQRYSNWRLLIRDDGSTDGTTNLINHFCKKLPNKIYYYADTKRLGPGKGFLEILQKSDAPYCMFCDQDDVWREDKIEISLSRIQQLPQDVPALIYTDLVVANESLQVLNTSLWAYQNIQPANNALRHLLHTNVVTGCTAIFNRRLVDLVGSVPNGIVMHDWWFALVASTFGELDYIPQATVLYRQHSNNDTGAKKYGLVNFIKNFNKSKIQFYARLDQSRCGQAKLFYDRYGVLMKHSDVQTVCGYIRAMQCMGIKRLVLLKQGRYFPHSGLRLLMLAISSFIVVKQ